jgi:hypothetical protein
MAVYQVTCINKRGGHYNPHERIQYIGNQADGWRLSEDAAIRRILNGTDSFYTFVNGRRANVIVAEHNGRRYLKTDADGYAPDNLLSLGDCTNGCKIIE